MKKIKIINDVMFNRVITVNDSNVKNLIVNSFGGLRDYYIEFIQKNYDLEEEEAIQLVDNYFKDFSLKKFFEIVKSLKIEILDEIELTKKKLLNREFIIQWFSDSYIGD
jgi:hypothetical protein